jgi:rhomboid family GlyGly-CTERM serine protease
VRPAPAAPWATLAVSALAAVALAWPAASEALIYERTRILHGEIWRAWTGHVVHFGASHFFWDLAVFLPAGCWLERLWPGRARGLYLAAPLVISATLLAWDPGLLRYAGLSGLATGVLALLAGLQLRRRGPEPVWFWAGVLALVAGKIAVELVTKQPLVVGGFAGIRTVPQAHIVGALCGAVLVLGRDER